MYKLKNIYKEIKLISSQIKHKDVVNKFYEIYKKNPLNYNLVKLENEYGYTDYVYETFRQWIESLPHDKLKSLYIGLIKIEKLDEIKLINAPTPQMVDELDDKFFNMDDEFGDYFKYKHPEIKKLRNEILVKAGFMEYDDEIKLTYNPSGMDFLTWLEQKSTPQIRKYIYNEFTKILNKYNLTEIKLIPSLGLNYNDVSNYIVKYIGKEPLSYHESVNGIKMGMELRYGNYLEVLDLGKYYTFSAYGNQLRVYLLPKNKFKIEGIGDANEEGVKEQVKFLRELIEKGQFKIIK